MLPGIKGLIILVESCQNKERRSLKQCENHLTSPFMFKLRIKRANKMMMHQIYKF